jgi:hypothetical protein
MERQDGEYRHRTQAVDSRDVGQRRTGVLPHGDILIPGLVRPSGVNSVPKGVSMVVED